MTEDSCKLAGKLSAMANYQTLDAWKKSMDLVKSVYDLVKGYPKEELYALSQQTKRAVVSIPSNIAEGIGRNYKKDTIQFLHISRGSLYELETLLLIAHSIDFLNESGIDFLTRQIQECLRLLNGLIAYYEKSNLK
jgi:four helix bundle protein